MIYIEMSRDEDHGGGTWGFSNCVWAPTRKKGGTSWPFWTKVSQVREGDIIIHLRGITPRAYFFGYSVASSDGFRTTRRPPNPGVWDFAEAFFRADLTGFTEFHQPVNLAELIASRSDYLSRYFDANKRRCETKANIFLVRQSGRLQCLNGAYLSDVDEGFLEALFGAGSRVTAPMSQKVVVSVETGSQIAVVRTRQGQERFASAIKLLYGNRCCFPGCNIADARFIVGAHIARWSDNELLRGHMGNGLCLCLLHDRAFEVGLFTLDEHFRVFVNPREKQSDSQVVRGLLEQDGEQIRLSEVKPLEDALLEHWIRVDLEP
jgi:putative restriction endonuclease